MIKCALAAWSCHERRYVIFMNFIIEAASELSAQTPTLTTTRTATAQATALGCLGRSQCIGFSLDLGGERGVAIAPISTCPTTPVTRLNRPIAAALASSYLLLSATAKLLNGTHFLLSLCCTPPPTRLGRRGWGGVGWGGGVMVTS